MSTFALTPIDPAFAFAGAAYDRARDADRLLTQMQAIREHASDRRWRTLNRLCVELMRVYPHLGFPEASVSAQLRNLKKLGYRLDRRHLCRGLFEYRLLPPLTAAEIAAESHGLTTEAEQRLRNGWTA